jgi:hypothetical protein
MAYEIQTHQVVSTCSVIVVVWLVVLIQVETGLVIDIHRGKMSTAAGGLARI